jgi:hypothetical protein
MPAHASVFISSTSDLRSARDRVANLLFSMNYYARSQENEPLDGGELLDVLRRRMEPCALMIQLVGSRYGAEPPDLRSAGAPSTEFGRVSYAQFEALHFEKLGRRVIYLFLDPAFPTSAAEPEPPELTALQAAYREQIKSKNRLRYEVANYDALEARILRLREDVPPDAAPPPRPPDRSADPDAPTITVVTNPTSLDFTQVMWLHDRRFGDEERLHADDFARLVNRQALDPSWLDWLVALKVGDRVVATVALDYSHARRLGLISYAATRKGANGQQEYYTAQLARYFQDLITTGALRNASTLLLEFEDPRKCPTEESRRKAIAKIRLYSYAVTAHQSDWQFRILDIPYVLPEIVCPNGCVPGGEEETLLGILTKSPARTLDRDAVKDLLAFLWKELYPHWVDKEEAGNARYETYVEKLYSQFVAALPEQVRLYTCKEFLRELKQ